MDRRGAKGLDAWGRVGKGKLGPVPGFGGGVEGVIFHFLILHYLPYTTQPNPGQDMTGTGARRIARTEYDIPEPRAPSP